MGHGAGFRLASKVAVNPVAAGLFFQLAGRRV